jgi:ferric iron reductase protein FhuF
VLLDRTATAAGTTSRAIAATWHLEKHAWYVASASLAAILVHGTMPPLEQALLRDAEEGWPDAIAVPPSDWTPANGATLGARLEAHLEPLVDALCHHRPARALWRSVSDRLGQAALWCGEAFADHRRAWALAGEAMTAPTALAAPTGFELVDGVPFRRRTGCCLSQRCQPALICDDCRLRR